MNGQADMTMATRRQTLEHAIMAGRIHWALDRGRSIIAARCLLLNNALFVSSRATSNVRNPALAYRSTRCDEHAEPAFAFITIDGEGTVIQVGEASHHARKSRDDNVKQGFCSIETNSGLHGLAQRLYPHPSSH